MRKYLINREKYERPAQQQCNNKERLSLKDARYKAKRVMKSGRVKEARIYECVFCGCWHIAKQHEHLLS